MGLLLLCGPFESSSVHVVRRVGCHSSELEGAASEYKVLGGRLRLAIYL